MSDAEQREEAVFDEARQLQGESRAAYLDQACAGDAALRERVEGLLGALDRAGDLLGEPAVVRDQVAPTPVLLPTAQPGDHVGPYKLLQQIGEGGCGMVYMAEQVKPVRRRVALKVLKLGMDTRQVIARFEAERQALALMEHPNIAKVLDAGATASGRPYFVMELVRGVKITDFCDENHLPMRERLELFIQVCQAVQHAHQKGIIHRDIKPSNILVTVNDGVPVPKVIDFGIAKATTGQPLTDKTLFTAFEQFIGTPAYMSPEQAVMTSVDIDTRSDIYSLGVLLYELLTGQTPLDTKELLQAGLDEMRRTIREKEPARPSTRLSTMAEGELTTTAKRRHTEALKLIHLVRGDLDWIVMKCLEKDRARRYETANGLARDIERHLNCEPVVARPPSKLYEFQRTVRRHKFGFAAAAAVMLVLAAGVVVSSWQAIRATHAEREQARLLQRANEAGNLAKQQEQFASMNAEDAHRQAGLATEQELLARRRFYAAQVGLAYQAWETGDMARTLELLETQRPAPGQKDLRTFEWYHLWGLCHARQIMSLRGHHNRILALAFAPDGKTLASASDGGTIRLWDIPSGQERAELQPPAWMNGVAFTPDGKTLISGSPDHLVRLWDVATGRLRTSLVGHTNWVQALAVSADGRTLASGAQGGVVKMWSLPDGRERASLTDRDGPLNSLAFTADSTTLATASGGGPKYEGVRLWDVTRDPPELKRRLVIGSETVAWSPDGKTLASDELEGVRLWDASTGKKAALLRGHFSKVMSVAWLDQGRLVSCSQDRTVRLWPLETNDVGRTQSQVLGVHLDAVTCLAVFRDGSLLASGGNDGSLRLWNVGATQEGAEARFTSIFRFGSRSNSWDDLRSLLVSPDSSTLYVVTDKGTRFRNIVAGFDDAEVPQAKGWGARSPDGKLLATGDRSGRVELWEVASGRLLASVQAHRRLASSLAFIRLAFSGDGRTLATGSFEDRRGVMLWEVETGLRLIRTIQVGGMGVYALEFFPDGRTLAIGARVRTIHLVDLSTRQPPRSLSWGHGVSEMWAAAVSPDGRLLATGGSAGDLMLWDATSGRLRATLKGHSAAVKAIAFSPGSETVVSGGDDQTVRFWDVATGQERVALKGHRSGVSSLAFSADGTSLVTGERDGTVRVLRANRAHDATAETALAGEVIAPTGGFKSGSGQVVVEEAQRPDQALLQDDSDPRVGMPNPDFWTRRAQLALRAGRTNDALASYAQAIEVIGTNSASFSNALSHALLGRASLLKSQGRLAEAQAEVQRAARCSPLETEVWLHSIDLSDHFNEPLPAARYAGVRESEGVVFDIRGVVHVSSAPQRPGGLPYPAKVEDIVLARKAQRLHFFHAAATQGFPITTAPGTTIGFYRMRFTDGRTQEFPIVFGQDVLVWEGDPAAESRNSRLTVAWRDKDKRLFRSVWENPWPEVELQSLDFIATQTDAEPFLVAITAE